MTVMVKKTCGANVSPEFALILLLCACLLKAGLLMISLAF